MNQYNQNLLNSEPFDSVYDRPLQSYPHWIFKNGNEYLPKYGRTINICINKRLKATHNLIGYAYPEICYTQNESSRELDTIDIAFMIFVTILILTLLTSTIIDYLMQQKSTRRLDDYYKEKLPNKFSNMLVSFSVYRNWQILIAQRPSNDIKIFHVLRCFFCTTNIFGHVLAFYIGGPIYNKDYIEESSRGILYNFIFSASIVVHVFYIMTAFLLSYKFFQHIEKNPKFDPMKLLMDVINRLARIGPLYVVLIFFASSWLIHLGDGPVWKIAAEVEYNYCRKNWWTNLLFINNYINADEPCLLQTYFLAIDFHMLIISTVIFGFIWKYPKTVRYLFSLSMIYSFVSVGFTVYVYSFDGVLSVWPESAKHFMLDTDVYQKLYIPTHVNTGNYFCGIICGYTYHQLKKHKINPTDNKVCRTE